MKEIEINKKKYTIKEVLGEGAFGIVFKAQDKSGNYVAIKKIKKEQFILEEKTFLEFFKNDCDVIVCFKDFEEKKEYVYIVMEYIEGEELNSRHIKEIEIRNLFKTLIIILKKLCDKNIYHLDIKPDNILVNKNTKEIKLADFGLACSKDKMKKNACGTSGYIAYEVLKDIKISCKADVFSMGATLYKLLTGKRIYKDYVLYHKNPVPYYEKAFNNILNLDMKYVDYHMIITDMIAILPQDRPTPTELLRRIKQLGNEEQDEEQDEEEKEQVSDDDKKYDTRIKKNDIDILSYIENMIEDYDEDFYDSKKEFVEELINEYKYTRKIQNIENKDIKKIEDKYNLKLSN